VNDLISNCFNGVLIIAMVSIFFQLTPLGIRCAWGSFIV